MGFTQKAIDFRFQEECIVQRDTRASRGHEVLSPKRSEQQTVDLAKSQPQSQKKILLVVDVSNLYYCIQKRFGVHRKLNYADFLRVITLNPNEKIYRAIAYGCELNGQALQFKHALTKCGFEYKYKKPKQFKTGRKADWDVGITVDVMSQIDQFDIVVFGTADGDFAPCLNYLKKMGKEVRVFAVRISYELKQVADQWAEIPEELIL